MRRQLPLPTKPAGRLDQFRFQFRHRSAGIVASMSWPEFSQKAVLESLRTTQRPPQEALHTGCALQ